MVTTACSDEPPTIDVAVTVGQESDVFSGIETVEIVGLDADGGEVVRGSAAPGGEVDLGEVPTDTLLTFEVRAEGGGAVVRGRSLAVLAGGIDGDAIPLFAQRTGSFARPPGALVNAHVGGVAAVIAERWLLSTGGDLAISAEGADVDPGAPEFYDLLAWGGAASTNLPRRARSIVTRGSAALIVDEAGATWVDFDSGSTFDAEAPSGVVWSLVAGGATVDAPDGVSYVVGGTRSRDRYGDFPVDDVLRVGSTGELSAAKLAAGRVGAAATWVDDVGLVVVGGTGDAAGVEVLGSGEATARPLPFATDRVEGAAVVPTGERSVVRVGGAFPESGASAPVVVLDLGCVEDCAPQIVLEAGRLPALRRTRAFSTPSGVITLGDDESGELRVFLVPLDGTAPTEAPLREPRRGAAVTAAPNGTLAILGGQRLDGTPAVNVEIWFPE